MKHAVSQELFQYWTKLRGARNAPERGDLDPAMIRGILADTFLIEVTSRVGTLDRRFSIRLSGTRVNALFLAELKQRCFVSLWRPHERRTVEETLNHVLDDQSGVVAGVRAAPPHAPDLDLELMLLPLRHQGHTHRRMLGSLAPFQIPSWLGLQAVDALELRSMRSLGGVIETGPPMAASPPLNAVKPIRRGRFLVHQGGH